MIDTEILDDYSSEARELLDEMDNSLMRLEKEGGTPELLNNIFRAVHCIKGSAEYIGLERSSTLTHGVENLLDRLREGALRLTPAIADFLFRAKDLIATLISEVSQHHTEKSEISWIMEELDKFLSGTAPEFPDTMAQMPRIAVSRDEMPPVEAVIPPEEVAEFTVVEQEDLARIRPGDEFPPELVDEAGSEETFDVGGDIPEGYLVDEFPGTEPPVEALASPRELAPFPDEPVPSIPDDWGPLGPEDTAGLVATLDAISEDEPLSVEETVALVLSISLYLDDLEDGVNTEESLSSMMQKLARLKANERFRSFPEAMDVIEAMESGIGSIEAAMGPASAREIDALRSLLNELRNYYPEGTFPLAPRVAAEPEPGAGEPPPPAPVVPSAFEVWLKGIPGITQAAMEGLLDAGLSSMEEVAALDMSALSKIGGITTPLARTLLIEAGVTPPEPAKRPVTKERPERSLLADVDDELLREFEGIFAGGPSLDSVPEDVAPVARGRRAADLLEELDATSAEADREIMEIFLSYGWEIMGKLRPVIERISQGRAERSDLDKSAELIKSIRSSSTYMDYQNLASFLDDWYEKTVWTSERIDSLSARDVEFMEDSLLRFEDFLVGLEAVVSPETAALRAAPIPAAPPTPAPPSKTPPPSAPPQPQMKAATPPRSKPTVPDDHLISARAKEPAVPVQARSVPAREATPEVVAAAVQRPVPAPAVPATVNPEVPAEAPTGEHLAPPAAQADISHDGALVKTMRVDSSKVDVLLNQVGELVVNRSFVEQLASELKGFQRMLVAAPQVTKREISMVKELALKVSEASVSLGRVANDIQEGVMKLRMLPVGQLFNRMPRLIRDLSRRVGKTVNLEVYGGDTEVDKRVIEQIYNPLVHLIRNAVDHGIEDRETRTQRGKNEDGSIVLRAYSEGNQVVIDVEDDGGGIDRDAVLRKALESRLIDTQDAKSVSLQEVYNFLFLPGFSTSDKVTRTSGRGVGMDVVKKDVEKINGRVEIESWQDQGTRISIKIPLTLAIIQTLLISSGKHVFAIPLTSVREIIQVSLHEIETIEGFEVIKFRDETIPVLRVTEIFNLKKTDAKRPPKFLVIATAGLKTTGFLVEELIGEQDVVIKPLAEHVCEIRGLAGSTILGDGTIALVMDVTEIVDDVIFQQRQAILQGARPMAAGAESPA